MNRKTKIVGLAAVGICVMIGVAFASMRVQSAGTYQSGVFGKYYGSGSFIQLSTSWQTLISLSLPNIPVTVYYYVVCDGHAACNGDEIEIAIGVDGVTVDTSTRRFYDATVTGIHTERLYSLGPGLHTFYFRARVYVDSTGVSSVNYHTITAAIFTDGSVISPAWVASPLGAPDGT
jgi:hypothetical protein